MKFLRKKSNGILFPWNPDHADRKEFEIYDDGVVEEKRIVESPVIDPIKTERRVYRRRSTVVVEPTKNDNGQ